MTNTVSLSGMTPFQAFAAIEKVVGFAVPDEVKQLLRDIAGDDGRFFDLQFIDTGDRFDLKGKVGGDDQKEALSRFEHDRQFLASDFGKQCQAELGPPPKYNGAVGDSCDCVACNYRRSVHGPSLTTDFEKNMSRTESENRTVEGYAKTGRTVPADKTLDAGKERFKNADLGALVAGMTRSYSSSEDKGQKISKALDPSIKLLEMLLKVAPEYATKTIREVSPHLVKDGNEVKALVGRDYGKARKQFIDIVGPDSEALVDFDRVNALASKGADVTIQEHLELAKTLERVSSIIGR